MGYYIGYIVSGFAIIIAIIIALVAQGKVSSAFNKYKDVSSSLDMTGAQLAEMLAQQYGVNIKIGSCRGTLSDHYNSRTKTLNISQANYNSKSLAAHAIVAHEFGHALQDKENYLALKLRQVVVTACNFVSTLLIPMVVIGLIMNLVFFMTAGSILIYVYVGIYAVSVLASLVTLPVEYNASARAKKLLYEMGCVSQEEVEGTDRLLNAAAMTYVASLLVSLAYFLRMLFLLLAITKDR